jgi:hypothetical protein
MTPDAMTAGAMTAVAAVQMNCRVGIAERTLGAASGIFCCTNPAFNRANTLAGSTIAVITRDRKPVVHVGLFCDTFLNPL